MGSHMHLSTCEYAKPISGHNYDADTTWEYGFPTQTSIIHRLRYLESPPTQPWNLMLMTDDFMVDEVVEVKHPPMGTGWKCHPSKLRH